MQIERWIIKSGEGERLLYWSGKYKEHCWDKDLSQVKVFNSLREAAKLIEKRRKNQQWLNCDIGPMKIVFEIVKTD